MNVFYLRNNKYIPIWTKMTVANNHIANRVAMSRKIVVEMYDDKSDEIIPCSFTAAKKLAKLIR